MAASLENSEAVKRFLEEYEIAEDAAHELRRLHVVDIYDEL
jgi:hypothetical protein